MRHFALPAATVFDLYQQHKSFGFVALALTLGRLGRKRGKTAGDRGWGGARSGDRGRFAR